MYVVTSCKHAQCKFHRRLVSLMVLCGLHAYLLYISYYIYRREYWYAEVSGEACYGGNARSCVMTFSFCHPLTPNVTQTGPCAQSPTSVCQSGEEDSGESVSYNMGMYEDYTLFYAS